MSFAQDTERLEAEVKQLTEDAEWVRSCMVGRSKRRAVKHQLGVVFFFKRTWYCIMFRVASLPTT